MEYRKYEVWHDESKVGGYHHGILFVPVDKKEEIVTFLKQIRKEHSITFTFHKKFANALKNEKNGRYINNILTLFSHIIQTQKAGVTKIHKVTEKHKHRREYPHFLEIRGVFNCRFGLLKIADNFKNFYGDSYAKKIELTFNFIFKCCCHGMFKESPIEITKFYFDGDEHHNNAIDLSNIIQKTSLRNYIKIAENVSLDSRQRDERDEDTGLMIDFVDNIVGAFRAKLNREKDKNNVLLPIEGIWERLAKKKIFANVNSSWYKSISCSEAVVNNGEIEFPNIFRNPDAPTLFLKD